LIALMSKLQETLPALLVLLSALPLEIGSTLVADEYRGLELQRTIYNHLIVFKRLVDWPGRLFAVVDGKAKHSAANIEKCGFKRQPTVPSELLDVYPGQRWKPVLDGKKHFYCLERKGLIEALLFVAAKGHTHHLLKKRRVNTPSITHRSKIFERAARPSGARSRGVRPQQSSKRWRKVRHVLVLIMDLPFLPRRARMLRARWDG
jgi:hypothetical protein